MPGSDLRKMYRDYLQMVGIRHLPRKVGGVQGDVVPREMTASPEGKKEKQMQDLILHIGECTRCRLCEGRRNIVFGVGTPDTPIMFIGEAPGVEEDRLGEPFVGAAGKKLNVWISRLGMKREEVYIANIVKCRPPENRTPRPDEASTCLPFLKRQIEIVVPPMIVTLGGPALNYLLGRNERITRVRGGEFDFLGIPLIPTFHPAYILRNPAKEKEVYLDLDFIREVVRRHGGG